MRDALTAGSARLAKKVLRSVATLPSACAVCHAWPSQPICADCIARFALREPRCRRCAIALPAAVVECGRCTVVPPPLHQCVAAVGWRWPWSDCIVRFKFGREPGWAAALAPLLQVAPGAGSLLAEADLVLPLPLAPERLRDRGFNQSLELARRLAPEKTDATLLSRVRHSPPQSSLARSERLKNVNGAFALDPARARALPGRRALLVDDVMTTGATLFEAAGVLLEAGAAQVTALVLARADETRPAALLPAG